MRRPFVFIAGLRRTGTTVLSEALTRLPKSFIFREPSLCGAVKGTDREALRPFGVNLAGMIQQGMYRTLPIEQVGVKEVRCYQWREWYRVNPDMRVIVTGRDPRDIYVSLDQRAREGKSGLRLDPPAAAHQLLSEWRSQWRIHKEIGALKVLYEELVSDPAGVMATVREYIDSPLDGIGDVGCFNRENPARVSEFRIHGEKITGARSGRWREVEDADLADRMNEVWRRMEKYREWWGLP